MTNRDTQTNELPDDETEVQRLFRVLRDGLPEKATVAECRRAIQQYQDELYRLVAAGNVTAIWMCDEVDVALAWLDTIADDDDLRLDRDTVLAGIDVPTACECKEMDDEG